MDYVLPGSEYNDVSFEFRSVIKYECPFGKVRYITVVLELDLSFANELGRSGFCKGKCFVFYNLW